MNSTWTALKKKFYRLTHRAGGLVFSVEATPPTKKPLVHVSLCKGGQHMDSIWTAYRQHMDSTQTAHRKYMAST